MKRRLLVSLLRLQKSTAAIISSKNVKYRKIIVLTFFLASTALAMLQQFLTKSGFSPPDLLFLPLMLTSIFFTFKTIFFIIPALIIRHFIIYPHETLTSFMFLNETFVAVKWLVLISITAFASEKYRELFAYESKFSKDLKMARLLQKTLLPKPFEIGHVRVTSYIKQSFLIGGDFYYFRPFKKKYVMLAIGDVMGKGIRASIAMAIIMGLFYEWGKKSIIPSIMVERINKRMTEFWGESYLFSTLFYGVFNEENQEFSYCTAGHHNAILARSKEDSLILEGEGIPVGIIKNHKWKIYNIKLNYGDKIVLFTDGIYEARNNQNKFYSSQKLLEVINTYKSLSAERLKNEIIDNINLFSGGPSKIDDDRALVVMELI